MRPPHDAQAARSRSSPAPQPGHLLIDRALEQAAPSPRPLAAGSLLNMELSHLAFQHRVLDLAADRRNPLLERVRFVSIVGANLDEFVMTRVAGFLRQVGHGNDKRTLDGLLPAEQLNAIRAAMDALLDRVHREVLPALHAALAEHGIEVLPFHALPEADRLALRRHHARAVDPLLTPLPVLPGRPFPHVRNLRPALAVQLRDAAGRPQLGVVSLPDRVPGLVPLPGGRRFTPLEGLIATLLPHHFPAQEVSGACLFRVTRSGNLSLGRDPPGDVVRAVARTVALRPFAPVVRMEVEEDAPDAVVEELFAAFAREAAESGSHLAEHELFRVPGLIDLKRLDAVASLPLPELRFPRRQRSSPLRREATVFDRIRRRPLLVRFPRHSFAGTVGRFIREAANDPAVEEIRITLYRTHRSSRLVRLLRRARRNGKRVMVFVEVKASFEERRNIEWGRSLEAAGIEVLYGPPSLKVHAKIATVRRREGSSTVTYSYVGTGNLNEGTAASYTDLGLFTADPGFGEELVAIFEALADRPATGEFSRLIVAPFNMRRRFLELIARETAHARAGRGGEITAKINGVADAEIVGALYEAARAGVRIDLIVRGICVLRPGVPGLSETLRVVSNAGRNLEHSRIFRFRNAGEPEYFIGSADWRGRNLSRRVEVIAPVERPLHRRRLDALLAERLNDPCAWDLQPDGSYRRRCE